MGRKLPLKSPSSVATSFYSSPTSSRLAKLSGLIDPRCILLPGRVSPIDPDAGVVPPLPLPLLHPHPPPASSVEDSVVLPPAEQPMAVLLALAALPSATVAPPPPGWPCGRQRTRRLACWMPGTWI